MNEELLASVFHQVESGKTTLKWCLKGVPNILFYQKLHTFLKKWPVTCQSTKVAIGKFYIAIDKNVRERGSRPDNVYRFIERVAKSSESDKLMTYDKGACITELKTMRSELKHCTDHVTSLNREVNELKQQLEESRKQLHSAQDALRDVTNNKLRLKKQRDIAERKASKLRDQNLSLEQEVAQLIDENTDLSVAISEVESELIGADACILGDREYTIQTKHGRRYSPAIRKLYYTLLSNQIPTSKITDIIKVVVKCFNLSIDVQHLKLPKRACASYMRKDELKTVSNAHKATVLCEHASGNKGFWMNTDGTTKAQKKLGAVGINGMVVSVNELPDGTAKSVISDVSRELEKLRETAHALNMPDADSINWTLIVSSTSDSASTQKRFNKLIEECRESDEKRFGPATFKAAALIENFCSMHVGINLRKAFLCGIACDDASSTSSERMHHPVDTLVHEFCKVFGKHGTPEYGCGVLNFQDFLTLMFTDSSLSNGSQEYYQSCARVNLDRQIGSRYFVTAANATKIVFLREAAVHFLKYTGRDAGNKLERDLYAKLLDTTEVAQLKADGLMFYHVYGDLVMLSKSNDLGKSALDMNEHYLELKIYLQEIEHRPELVMEKDYVVFRSEKELYGDNKRINHRLHLTSQAVYEKLFEENEQELDMLYPMLVAGAARMREKLCTYAQDHLPGGKYWNPDDPDVKKVLSELKPSNDFCESMLGLNDYLTTAIPNLHPMARSNLVELKKNKSMRWLNELTDDQQGKVMDLAIESRQKVCKEYKDEEEERAMERRKHMAQAHIRREALKLKAHQERNALSQLHLITTSEELQQAISDIDNKSLSAAKKTAEKRSLLSTQIKIRKKVLGQNIHITFSHLRKQRPTSEILKELSQYIDEHPTECSELIQDPSVLVGKHISHKFEIATKPSDLP